VHRWHTSPVGAASLCGTAESPLRFVDKLAILQYFDGGDPGERQQIIRTSLGVSIIVTVGEVTPHVAAMQIEYAKMIDRHARHKQQKSAAGRKDAFNGERFK